MDSVKASIIYYSATGTVFALAEGAAEGAEKAGAEVRLRKVRELAPAATIDANPDWAAHLQDVRAADGLNIAEMLRDGADLAIGIHRPQPPYAAEPLAVLPVWAYVPPSDPWVERERVDLDELVARPLIGLPSTFTAREALDAAVAARGTTYASFVEAASGTIAQALAATGRGVAVVSDDPRFDLVPLAVDVDGELLCIRLVAGWDPRSVAAAEARSLAARLSAWIADRYGAGRP